MQASDPQRRDYQANSGTAIGYLLAVVGSLLAVLLAAAAERWVGLDDLSLVFMLAVLVVAARTRTGPAVLTAVLCFLAYNFFFIEPRYTLYIGARQGVATVLLFLAAALAGRTPGLAAGDAGAGAAHGEPRMRERGRNSGSALPSPRTRSEVVHGGERGLPTQPGRRCLDPARRARPACRRRRTAGAPRAAPDRRPGGTPQHAETVEEHGWWFLPLRAPQRTLGVIGLKLPAHVSASTKSQRHLARAMADDIAQALLRTRLVADLQSERVANETERLRSALLSSVSHDLRTPLAVDHRRGQQPGQLRRRDERGGPPRPARHHPQRRRAPRSLHPEPARHDPPRPRRRSPSIATGSASTN